MVDGPDKSEIPSSKSSVVDDNDKSFEKLDPTKLVHEIYGQPKTGLLQLIDQLGYDNPKDTNSYLYRDAAQKKLTNAGFDALPALKEAVKNPDVEIKLRAQQIVEELYSQTLKWESISENMRTYEKEHKIDRLINVMQLLDIPLKEAQKRAQVGKELIDIITELNQFPEKDTVISRLKELKDDNFDLNKTKQRIVEQTKNVTTLYLASEDLKEKGDLLATLKLCTNLKNLSIVHFLSITKEELNAICELQNLEKLSLHCGEQEKLEKIPKNIHYLDIVNCHKLVQLPELHDNLKSLYCTDSESLEQLPRLPKGLESLEIRHCINLKKIPVLPDNLKVLSINGRNKLEKLPDLPDKLTALTFCDNEIITELKQLPAGLKHLRLMRCGNLNQLPDLLPNGLSELKTTNCPNLFLTEEEINKIQNEHPGLTFTR